eukprot:c14646_g1_i1 orf=1160-3871(-)
MLTWLGATMPRPCSAGRGALHCKLLLKHSAFSLSPRGRFCTTAQKGATALSPSLLYAEKFAHIRKGKETHLNKHTENTELQETHVGKHIESTELHETHLSSHITQLLSTPELLARTLDQLHPPFCHADFVYLAALLRACGNVCAFIHGRLLHTHIIKCKVDQIIFLQNLILQMYGKCGAVDDARALFAKMHQHDQYSWNFMASAYTQNAEWSLAFELYNQLCMEGIVVDEYVLSSILTASAGRESLLQGKHIHACIVGSEYESVEAVGNALVNFYGRCDRLIDAWTVFSKMSERSVISMSSMITACTEHNHGEEAIWLWSCMQQEALAPNRATVVGILDACANLSALYKGKQVHCCLSGSQLDSDGMVLTTLINMYGKCGDMENALKAFEGLREQNVVSWTAIMAGYAQHGHSKDALQIFEKMQRNGVVPNKITYVCILDAFNSKKDLEKAKQMHACIKHSGFDSDIVVATAIVNMYGKCGSPRDARMMFDEMPERNIVSWNTMLSVYVQHGHGKQAFELFNLMSRMEETVNKITFISMLSACASEGALSEGKWMHDEVVRRGYDKDVVVSNAIINMYSKCGQVKPARNVFERISGRTVVSWSSMIAAYAQHGHGKDVLPMLHRMKNEGVLPSLVTFKAILSACSHAGLVDDAHACLNSMSQIFGLKPDSEHYDCVIDLLGRAGSLDQVEEMISKMPVQPSLISWMMLLGAYSSQADLQRGECVANQVFEMYPECTAPYVILSNMYVAAGRDSDAERLLSRMKAKGLMEQQDCSYIEVDGKVNKFSSVDQPYPQAEEICLELRRLKRLIAEAGFEFVSNEGPVDLKDQSKDCGTCHHTETLALAFGFLSTDYRNNLFIAKSGQMCCQCHLFAKLVSKVCDRQIIISDSCQLHRIQDGSCSCEQ